MTDEDEAEEKAGAFPFVTADGEQVEVADRCVDVEADSWKDSGIGSIQGQSVVPLSKLLPADHTLALIVDGEVVAVVDGPEGTLRAAADGEADQ